MTFSEEWHEAQLRRIKNKKNQMVQKTIADFNSKHAKTIKKLETQLAKSDDRKFCPKFPYCVGKSFESGFIQ